MKGGSSQARGRGGVCATPRVSPRSDQRCPMPAGGAAPLLVTTAALRYCATPCHCVRCVAVGQWALGGGQAGGQQGP